MEVIIKSILLGYFLTGWAGLIKEQNTPLLEKSGLMLNPTFMKKVYWVIAWPLHLYIDTYYMHMPNKERAIVYGIFTIPIMWLGFSIWGYLIVLPHLVIDNNVLSYIVSFVCIFLGILVLMPILMAICALLLIAITFPIVHFLPRRDSFE